MKHDLLLNVQLLGYSRKAGRPGEFLTANEIARKAGVDPDEIRKFYLKGSIDGCTVAGDYRERKQWLVELESLKAR